VRQVTIHAAKTNLSKLIEAALAGEEVVIAKGRTPVVRLTPVVRGAFKVVLLSDKLSPGPNFFEPQDEADLRLWEGFPD
jgi:prevent-host-death family protein